MKPRDLKSLFPKETPRIVYEKLFLALPTRSLNSFQLPPWEEVFGNRHPISIEYCSGNGHWIIEQAKAHPDQNWIAVEWQFDRARRIWSKRENEGLTNLLIVCGEALRFTKHQVASGSLSHAYVHFPDPWPKRRHAKYRLMRPPFFEELARVLRVGGDLTFVTDDLPYMQEALQGISSLRSWKAQIESPGYQTISEYGFSTFGSLWKELGKDFLLTRFVRKEERPCIGCLEETVRSVVLDCSARSSLKWNVRPGLPALWELQTDLFDSPHGEMAIRSFECAIDHWIETIFPFHPTFGVLLYKGKAPAPTALLRSLAARLPDSVTPYLALDLSDYEESDFFHALKRDELEHFGWILKGGRWPYATVALGWDQPSPWGFYGTGPAQLLPPKKLSQALCYSEGARFTLPHEPCRVIPEALLIQEWEGIDRLIAVAPSKMGERKVAGFAATGGEVTKILSA